MKKYNQNNFSRYKQDVKASQPEGKFWDEYTRDELIIKFMPLVENIARKFKDSDAANGVVSLIDKILNPLACKARNAVSLPEPGPFTSTDKTFMPHSIAFAAAASAAT